MPRDLHEVIAALSPEARDRIARRTKELVRQTSLRELRRALGMTQKQLAGVLRVSQAAISRQEQRQGLELSTLCEVVRAMGGQLEILARFPGDTVVRL